MNIPGAQVTDARRKVYPRHVVGRFRRLRNGISLMLQWLLFSLPWMQWHGRQAVLADLPGRKLHLFGLVLHPQDTYFLLLLCVCAVMLLTTVSALAGRMWCGFACPQTIFTQAFIAVERFWEGDRAARLRLDKSGWTMRKIRIKLSKWICWAIMGGWLGFTFSGYFLPIRESLAQIMSGQVERATRNAIAFFTAISLFDFGYFREQFCWYVCPYARLQGTMLDSDSLIVGYDSRRGEPRGKAKDSNRGSCIDCSLCVQVCPAGIDIREGLQAECIACTACIDACDQVMDKIQQPRGLIRYSSLNGLEGKPARVLRPRLLIYTAVLLALAALLSYCVVSRPAFTLGALRVMKPGGQLASFTPDGRVSNIFQLDLVNGLARPAQIELLVEGMEGAQMVGLQNPVSIEGGQILEFQVLVLMPQGTSRGVHHLQFVARSGGNREQAEATFFIP